MTRAIAEGRIAFAVFFWVLATLLFAGATFWAKARDPFARAWFTLKTERSGKVDAVAVIQKRVTTEWSVVGSDERVQGPKSRVQTPKDPTSGRLPVVIYSHGAGGSLLGSGSELRQMAEMGAVAVGIDYSQTNEAAFDEQFIALHRWVARQKWADTNRIAWVGFSLGARRQLEFFLKHPEFAPKLLVRVSGDWSEKLEPPTSNLQGSTNIQIPKLLLVHAERDDVFPLGDARRVAASFETNRFHPAPQTENSSTNPLPANPSPNSPSLQHSNTPAIQLAVVPGESHSLGKNRLLIFREIGEYCRNHLLDNSPQFAELTDRAPFRDYGSILWFQNHAAPLWPFWLPAAAWVGYCLWSRMRKKATPVERDKADLQDSLGSSRLCGSNPPPTTAETRQRNHGGAAGTAEVTQSRDFQRSAAPEKLHAWEVGLRWVAGVLAIAAMIQTAVHVIPPRLAISKRTLAIARKHLVQKKALSDFDYLAGKQVLSVQSSVFSNAAPLPLGTLLTHVELANYNRELINWKLQEDIYREFVLSPEIHPAYDGQMNWRRELWENFYPRIRKQDTVEAAAEIIVRFLRERVTVLKREGPEPKVQSPKSGSGWLPQTIDDIWERQITDDGGFEAVYVAALRSAGVPARLEAVAGKAELCSGRDWKPAPRPVLMSLLP